ncbi:MAG: SIS domain-containing protein [Candidatus Lokiarchaeota archaeon]|nr:SIS domain-containing protein [Candidatus Lokiarchaeota archaeon]
MVQRDAGSITMEEIWQIPEMLQRVLKPKNQICDLVDKILENEIKSIHLVGDGTSYHAGFLGSYLFNQLCKIKSFAEVSPEFPYLVGSILNKEDLVIGISQSGESEMTVESLKVARSMGCLTATISNYTDSSLAKLSDNVLELKCTKEKSVLATKTYVNTLGVLSRLALELAYMNKKINEDIYSTTLQELKAIPDIIKNSLQHFRKQVRHFAPYFKFAPICFVLGSGPDYGSALEISLKLIEGARIFSQAYSTAEFPHGPITLADQSSWILAIIPGGGDRRKSILKLLDKVKDRGATLMSLYTTEIMDNVDFGIHIPRTNMMFQPMVCIVPVQMLTVEIALEKGINPDKPKWLSKVSSV